MSLKNLECKLAQAQLARYISGEPISPDILRHLEDHVAECRECKAEISERKRALETVLTPSHAVVQLPQGELEENSKPLSAARERLLTALSGATPTKKKDFRKPLLLATALAVVLFAMSYISKDPTRLMGNTVADRIAQEARPVYPPSAETSAPSKILTDSEPVAKEPEPEVKEPAAKPVPEVKVNEVAKAKVEPEPPVKSAHRTISPRKRAVRAPRPASSGIRVYDESGKVIN